MTDDLHAPELRYRRHLLLPNIGGAGQQKLNSARVLIIGMGGLGCPLAQYLTVSGIGTLGLVDNDIVELSNLQRQILFYENHIGQNKTVAACETLASLNSKTSFEIHTLRVTAENISTLIGDYDVVADCSDNFETRFIISDACYYQKKPLVSAAAIGFQGQLTTLKPYLNDADGVPLPSYRCLVPTDVSSEDDCTTQGVLGAITGTLGSLQAVEVVKEILSIGESLAGRLLIYDGLSSTIRTIKLPHDPSNPLTGIKSKT